MSDLSSGPWLHVTTSPLDIGYTLQKNSVIGTKYVVGQKGCSQMPISFYREKKRLILRISEQILLWTLPRARSRAFQKTYLWVTTECDFLKFLFNF